MLFVTLISGLVLVSMMKRCTSDVSRQIQLIEKNTIVENTSPLYNTIRIGDGGKKSNCEICMPNPPAEISSNLHQKYKLYAFNLFLNCKFANWTINKIYDVLKASPLFYQHTIRSFKHYDGEYRKPFDEQIITLISHFDDNVERFVQILNVLIDLTPKSSYYSDTHILKSLLSLKIKLHFIPTMQNDPSDGSSEADSKIVRLLLIDMIELQKFLSMHCSEKPSSKNNSQFYGYWVELDHNLKSNEIALVMEIINEKYQFRSATEQDHSSCDVSRYFDTTTSNVDENSPIVYVINNALVDLSPDVTSLCLIDFWEKIKTLYDIDLFFEYQNLIYVAIVDLICIKLDDHLRDESLDESIVRKIQDTHTRITKSKNRVPEYLIKGYRVLNAFVEKRGDIDLEILDRVRFKNSHSHIQVTELLDIIDANMDDIVCFNRIFSSVRREHGKMYLPPTKNKTAVLPADKSDTSELQCVFVRNIYSLGYEAILHLNWYTDLPDLTMRETHLSKFYETFTDIYNYCYIASENISDEDIRETALDVVVIVSSMPVSQISTSRTIEVVRSFKVIMNIMDGYAITNCNTIFPAFLLINNISLKDIGNKRMVHESMAMFFARNIYDFDSEEFENFMAKREELFLNLKTFNESNVKGNNVVQRFQKKIKVNWKGLILDLVDIFNYEEHLVLNPRNLYALYDLFFVYSAAIIFSHIRNVVFKYNNFKTILKNFTQILDGLNVDESDWCASFPWHLKSFVKDIDNLLRFSGENSDPNSGGVSKLKENIKQIKVRFERFDIVFTGYNYSVLSLKYLSKNSKKIVEERALLQPLILQLESVSKNYSKLNFSTSNTSEDHTSEDHTSEEHSSEEHSSEDHTSDDESDDDGIERMKLK